MKKYSPLLKIKKSDRKIIGIFIMLAVSGFLLYLIVPAQLNNLQLVRKQLRYQTDLIKARNNKVSSLLLIRQRYSDRMNDAQKMRDRFFSPEQAADFLKRIDDIAERETGNNLLLMLPLFEIDIKEDNGDDEFLYKKKIVKLSLEGSYGSIEDLFLRFDDYEKLMRIEGVKITYNEKTSRVSVQLELSLYISSEIETESAFSLIRAET
ncbi:MAG TPA: hypothetical protein ENH40_00365 [Nitrospirae bacterium]|nr:hypothetical protein [Nitrospirota bacterium]